MCDLDFDERYCNIEKQIYSINYCPFRNTFLTLQLGQLSNNLIIYCRSIMFSTSQQFIDKKNQIINSKIFHK